MWHVTGCVQRGMNGRPLRSLAHRLTDVLLIISDSPPTAIAVRWIPRCIAQLAQTTERHTCRPRRMLTAGTPSLTSLMLLAMSMTARAPTTSGWRGGTTLRWASPLSVPSSGVLRGLLTMGSCGLLQVTLPCSGLLRKVCARPALAGSHHQEKYSSPDRRYCATPLFSDYWILASGAQLMMKRWPYAPPERCRQATSQKRVLASERSPAHL